MCCVRYFLAIKKKKAKERERGEKEGGIHRAKD